jgi:hypothetical protein
MSCPGIPNFDNIPLNHLEDEYNKLTNPEDKNIFKACLQTKYSSISPKCDVVPGLLSNYDKQLQRNITATEMNEQSREQYITDVFYLIFKILIFVVLGICYYLFIKSPQAALEAVKGATEKVKDVAGKVKETAEKVKDTASEVKVDVTK